MGNESEHAIWERIAVVETRIESLIDDLAKFETLLHSKKEESVFSTKIGGLELRIWLILTGFLTALGQGPDLLKIIEAVLKSGIVK
jgi:uncharacterized membrane protein